MSKYKKYYTEEDIEIDKKDLPPSNLIFSQRNQWNENIRKDCPNCFLRLPLYEFHLSNQTRDGRTSSCKKCFNKKRIHRYGIREKEKYKTVEGKIRILGNNIKYRSKKKNIEHNLNNEYLLELWKSQKGKCNITGLEFVLDEGFGFKGNGPHLDRIDPNKGYIIGNVQWMIGWVNIMKSNHTMEEFKDKISMLHNALNT